MLIHNLDLIPQSFKDGIRAIFLLHRNKDGESGNAQRKSIKRVSRNAKEWHEIVSHFAILQQDSYSGHRIYASVNSRCMEKAVREFKRRQLDNDYAAGDIKDWFYVDIQNTFLSCLMNPSCRNEGNFLIDCDTNEQLKDALKIIPKNFIIFDYPTKNGHHIITHPFNPNDYQGLEIKKDDLMYLG